MELFDYRDAPLPRDARVFPAHLNLSPWVLFHGTTNVSEDEIERRGFAWRNQPYDVDDVESVLRVFEAMDWVGVGSDAYVALNLYARNIDFSGGNRKPVFFSAVSEATMGYTYPHRTGGETAGCLRYALQNLEWFGTDPAIRANFRAQRYQRLLALTAKTGIPREALAITPSEATAADCGKLADHLRRLGIPTYSQVSVDGKTAPFSPWDEDLSWLQSRLAELRPLAERLDAQARAYAYGVIYAVEFRSEDASAFSDFNTGLNHGYAYLGELLDASRVVAKALLSPNQPRLGTKPRPGEELPRIRDGILGALMPDDKRAKRVADLEHLTVAFG